MENEVDFRNRKGNDWSYIEENVNTEDVGICWNSFPHIYTPSTIVPQKSPMCGTGMIRRERSGMRNRKDDITEDSDYFFFDECIACPYFISYKELTEIKNSHFKEGE